MGEKSMDLGEKSQTQKGGNCLTRLSNFIVEGMESGFYKLGSLIGHHPWRVILICILVVILCVPGIPLFFHEETRGEKLWVPSDAETLTSQHKVDKWFPTKVRRNNLLVVAENVLTPSVIQAMLTIDQDIKAIEKDGSFTWETICAKQGSECWSNSLLELWSFDETVINALTEQDILDTVNNVTASPVFHSEYNVELVAGKITRDPITNLITGAEGTTMLYVIASNETSTTLGEDENADDWEDAFLTIAEKAKDDAAFEKLYRSAVRSFEDESAGAILKDLNLMFAGYVLIIVFVAAILGRFNRVQHRVYLALGGVLCVGLSIGVSFGLCSYFQVDYGPLHNVLPFLLIGIGVDDMFVIVQAWETLPAHEQGLPVAEKIALMMKEAGVSITVTSLTDILAFGIGATTVIPALQSFCIYASVGILATFVLQATLLVAFMVLDQTRVTKDKDACCCCITYDDFVPSECSQKSLLQYFFDKFYAPFLMKLPVKIVFTVLTLAILAGGCYGVVKLEQDFDPIWFIPSDSYAYKYDEANKDFFPSDGYNTAVYMGPIDYYNEWDTLETLYDDLATNEYTYVGTVECWYMSFKDWLDTAPAVASGLVDGDNFPTTEDNFYSLVVAYASVPAGIRFAKDIQFTDTVPKIVSASRITLKHRSLKDASEEIDAMESIREVAKDTGLGGDCMVYSFEYVTFETNKIIQVELYRNLGLAFICIFLMILLLIANLWTCLLVSLCVIMAVLDVGGAVWYWGLTIDTVITIQLILAMGLAIDYSAHIGHSFMTITGTREVRVKKTLHAIGPAVWNGGFSTFLAFVMLSASTSYVFKTFFKIFLSVVVFGLIHGLIFLPIMLSWIGPAPYSTARDPDEEHPELQPQEKYADTNMNKNESNGEPNGYSNPALDVTEDSSVPEPTEHHYNNDLEMGHVNAS